MARQETSERLFFRKFRRNKLAVAGLIFILLIAFIALSGYLFLPDQSTAANKMQLSIALKKPGFSVNILQPFPDTLETGFWEKWWNGEAGIEEEIPVDTVYYSKDTLFYRKYSLGHDAPLDYLVADDKMKTHVAEGNHYSRRTYLLGTDRFGRDVLSRLLLGTRVSLSVGFIAVLISLFVGVMLGLLAGYYKGWVDKSIMWLINVIWSLPTLLIVIAMSMALGKGFWQIFVAVGLSMWVELARMVRGQVLSTRELEYVQAAQVLGFSDLRIMLKHILPNIMAPVIVVCTANFASAILLEAGLSFLGLGVQPPMPSWGMMIKEHYSFIVFDAAHLAIAPGLAIMLTVMAFNFAGNGLRDALDVKN